MRNQKGSAALAILVAVVLVCVVAIGVAIVTHKSTDTQASGGASGPESSNGYQCYNGVCTFYNRKPLNTASTTVCAIQSPSATSTLVKPGSGIVERVSSTTASIITIARATTAYATTTLIGSQMAVAANAQAAVVASTTAAQDGAGADVFPPNTWYVIGQQGGTGTFSPSGFCHADFRVL